ncbi:MAG: OmpA family protein [Bacteroidetes bacterium]|nr:OmpA family protein [Bacteroidota bacterium]MBU1579861.1 OmpA family protein [Bacteroidota bacterium]MBU2556910.1 OmpA family protein [Bacteroidota bacterium]
MAYRICDEASAMAHQPAKPQIYAYSLIVLLLLLGSSAAVAQEFTTRNNTSKKALKAYEKAEQQYVQYNFPESIALLKQALDKDPLLIDAWLLMGDAAAALDSNSLALEAYENAYALSPFYYPPTAYMLGKAYLESRRFDQAVEVLATLLQHSDLPAELLKEAEQVRQTAVFRKAAYAQPVPFDPLPLEPSINSAADEYVNALRLDGRMLVFTRRSVQEQKSPPMLERLMLAEADSSSWSLAEVFSPDWPVTEQIGAVTFSADGLQIYFAACGWPDSKGSCDLYLSQYSDGAWQRPVNLGNAINSGYWESQPSISADGRQLFFASNRSGGAGGSDLWKSSLNGDGSWSKPVNLGEQVNSEGNEMAPFLHPDGKTLYFSSDGLIGLGGADLFVSRLDTAGQWQQAVNMGYPVNTTSDEINLVVAASGKTALLSALSDSTQTYDILSFSLPAQHRPQPVTYLQIVARDLETKAPLQARLVLSDPRTARELITDSTDISGASFVVIPAKDSYALQLSSEGYLFYDSFIRPEAGTELEPAEIEIFLERIKSGKTVVLDNILFQVNQAVLLAEAYAGLHNLEQFLSQNPGLKVRIEGHTDNSGGDSFNQKLSQDRAQAVAGFLTDRGIDPKRIEVAGFGSNRPIASNETDKGRAKNRRVELRIISGF